jgi:hypothetical protein
MHDVVMGVELVLQGCTAVQYTVLAVYKLLRVGR